MFDADFKCLAFDWQQLESHVLGGLRCPIFVRSGLWLAFFGSILAAWAMMYMMSVDMDVDWIGRPVRWRAMAAMDPRMPMYMPMADLARCLPCGRS